MSTEEQLEADTETLQRLRAGESDAAAELYERYYQEVLWTVRRKLPDQETAEECASEAFTKVLEIIGRGKGPEQNFRAYVHTVALRVSADWYHYREQKQRLEELEQGEDWLAADASSALDEAVSAIVVALEQLPPELRQLLTMRIIEEQKPAEIAATLGTSIGKLRTQLYRAKQALRSEYLTQIALTHSSGSCVEYSKALAELVEHQGVWAEEAAQTEKVLQAKPRPLSTKKQRRIAHTQSHLNDCADCETTKAELLYRMNKFGSATLASALLISYTVAEYGDQAQAAMLHPKSSTANGGSGTSTPATPMSQELSRAGIQAVTQAGTRGWLGGGLTAGSLGSVLGPVLTLGAGALLISAVVFFGGNVLAGKTSAVPGNTGGERTVELGGASGNGTELKIAPPQADCTLTVLRDGAQLHVTTTVGETVCELTIEHDRTAIQSGVLSRGKHQLIVSVPGEYRFEVGSPSGVESSELTLR